MSENVEAYLAIHALLVPMRAHCPAEKVAEVVKLRTEESRRWWRLTPEERGQALLAISRRG